MNKFSIFHNGIKNTIPNGEIDIKEFEKNGEIIKYDAYIRIEEIPCKLLSQEDLIINECPNKKHIGNKRFPLDMKFCPNCPTHKKGKEKGQEWKLNKRLNDKDICQMYRGNFIKKK